MWKMINSPTCNRLQKLSKLETFIQKSVLKVIIDFVTMLIGAEINKQVLHSHWRKSISIVNKSAINQRI